MSLIEAITPEEEIERLHTVIDTRLFGARVTAVRELQGKVRIFCDCFASLDNIELPAEARKVIEACKVGLGMIEAPKATEATNG